MGRRGKGKASKGADNSDDESSGGGLMISVEAPATFSMQMPTSPLAPPGLESVPDSSAAASEAPQGESQNFKSAVLNILMGGGDEEDTPATYWGNPVKNTFIHFHPDEPPEIDLPKSNTAPPEYHKLAQNDFTQLTPVGENTTDWDDPEHGTNPFVQGGLTAWAAADDTANYTEPQHDDPRIINDNQMRWGRTIDQPVLVAVELQAKEPEHLKEKIRSIHLSRRNPKDKFGLAFDTKDRTVFGVMPWSPVAYWNIEHPEAAVEDGDVVVSVNGVVELDGEHGMCELLMTALDVEIHVLKHGDESDQTAKFKQGTRVVLKDLAQNSKFNGATGRVLAPLGPIDGSIGWVNVMLDDGTAVEVAPTCAEIYVEPAKPEADSDGEGHDNEGKTGRRRRRRRAKGPGAAAQGEPEPPVEITSQPPAPAEEAWRSSFVRSQRVGSTPELYDRMLKFLNQHSSEVQAL
mmetsp:Transcript_57858/g.131255  ORF Transcript_57858/g.131255 Transcript_57858/m.131255 type:complete len:461 (+) Transcript_57858:220-1602(+)